MIVETPPKPNIREELKKDVIKVKFEDGQWYEVPHPLVEPSHDEKKIQSNDMVQVSIWDFKTKMSFEKCLEVFFGTTYNNYFRILKEHDEMDQKGVLRQLHLEVIEKRRQEALALDKEYSGGNQEATAKEHSPMFVRIINELGIDGISAEIGQLRNDYKDKIDDFLVVDPARLEEFIAGKIKEMNGKRPIYIGVQRTFDTSAVKRAEIINDPIKILPEKPGEPVFVVFLEESVDEYVDQPNTNEEYALWQRLLDKRMEEARKEGKTLEKYLDEKPGDDRLALVSEVLPKGFAQQKRKAIKVFKEVIAQWQAFRRSSKFAELPEIVRQRLEINFSDLEKLDIPKIIKEET